MVISEQEKKFIKRAFYFSDPSETGTKREITALSKPDWPEYNLDRLKVSDIDKLMPTESGGFNLAAAIKENPESLFVKVFAIKKDEVNDNGDAFSEAELMRAASTFVGVPVFCNHQNDDIEKARGKVVHAWYDQDRGGIYIISMVDRVAYPKLARGIEEGYITGTSMGCSVEYSLCSVCHNKAATADEYCDCVKFRKNKKFSGRKVCSYQKSKGNPQDPCPVCGTKLGESKSFEYKESRIYEHNFGIKFIEDSFVVNPACHDCLVAEIFNVAGFGKKVADVKDKVMKISGIVCQSGTCPVGVNRAGLLKVAGKSEIDDLSEAMQRIERVAKSMMAQKQHVSLEYVSDLVDALAQVQSIADELIEMGYAQLPSPPPQSLGAQALPQRANGTFDQYPQMTGGLQQQQPNTPSMGFAQPAAGAEAGDLGGLGSVVKPKFSSSDVGKKKEFITSEGNVRDKIAALRGLQNRIGIVADLLEGGISSRTVPFEGPLDYDAEVEAIRREQEYVTQLKESNSMSDTKTGQNQSASKVAAAPDVTTEKQLAGADLKLHPRENSAPDVITEKQLKSPPDVNLTTSETPQKRQESFAEVATEKQLEGDKGNDIVRWGDYADVITQKQWDLEYANMAREIGSVIGKDYTEVITEKQLKDFMSHHQYVSPDVVTEKQLAADKGNEIVRSSYKYDPKALVKSAQEVIADAMAYFKKTPAEILKAATYINNATKTVEKAAFIIIANSQASRAEARKAEKARYQYFSKLASVNGPDVLDSLLVSAADHLSTHSADDLLHAIKHVASSEKAMAQVEELVKQRLASPVEQVQTLDKSASLDSAIAELDRPQDGLYQVTVKMAEVGVDKTDKAAFVSSVYKLANTLINDNGVKTALMKIDLNPKAQLVTATLKDVTKLTESEKKAVEAASAALAKISKKRVGEGDTDMSDAEIDTYINTNQQNKPQKPKAKKAETRETMEKQAQMLGGEMGGGAGGGATMPPPPAGGPAGGGDPTGGSNPLESFEQSDLDAGDETEGDNQPKPPGATCPACGSGDVDIIKGEGKCNNCTAEFKYTVQILVTKWPDLLEDTKDTEGGEAEGAGEEGEGFEMPNENAPAAPPAPPAGGAAPPPAGGPAGGMGAMGASKGNNSLKKEGQAKVTRRIGGYGSRIRFTPELSKRLAEIRAKIAACKTDADFEKLAARVRDGGMGIKPELAKEIAAGRVQLGQISPASGSSNTVQLDKEHYACLDTGTVYRMAFVTDRKDPKQVYTEWTWKPSNGEKECTSCGRARKAFAKALASLGIKEAQFDRMPWKSRAEIIEKLRTSGALKQVKTASKREASIISDFKKVAGFSEELNKAFFNKFPIETCRRKLANRFGENAVALSGPCEGQNLADCVCKSLKKASVYSDGLAIKVASIWGDYEGSLKCIEDRVREGFELKTASACCEAMKARFAGHDDQFTEELADTMTQEGPTDGPEGIPSEQPVDQDSDMDAAFDGGETMGETPDMGGAPDAGGAPAPEVGGDTVSIEVPKALVEELDKVFDVALGENPATEEHHDEAGLGGGEVGIDVGGEGGVDIGADGAGLDGGEPSPMEGGDAGGGGGGDMSAARGGPVGGGVPGAAFGAPQPQAPAQQGPPTGYGKHESDQRQQWNKQTGGMLGNAFNPMQQDNLPKAPPQGATPGYAPAVGGPVGGGTAAPAPAAAPAGGAPKGAPAGGAMSPMMGGPIEVALDGIDLGGDIPLQIIDETGELGGGEVGEESHEEGHEGPDDDDKGPSGAPSPESHEDESEENSEIEEGISEDHSEKDEGNSPVSDEEGTYKEGDEKNSFTPEEKEAKHMTDDLLKHAKQMHRSSIGQTGKINLDLRALAARLNKKADGVPESETVKIKEQGLTEKGLVQENAQDSKDIGKVDGDQKFPNEKPVADKKPEVPSKGDGSKIGEEKPAKAADPKVPAGKGKFENEPNEGGDTRATGGDNAQGSGKVASNSYKQRLADLAARIVANRNVLAEQKKIDDKKQNQDRPDNVGKYSDGNGALGDEKPFEAGEITEKDYTGGSDAGFHNDEERKSVGSKPNFPKDAPEAPVGGGHIGNEPNDSEQESSINGTVATAQESEARKKVYAEAVRIAGRMVEEGKCKANDLLSKIAELQRYELGTLKDIEKYIFSVPSATAGLDTVSNGVEQAVIVAGSDSEGIQKSAQSEKDELASKLQGLFSLHRKNAQADSDRTIQLRRAMGR